MEDELEWKADSLSRHSLHPAEGVTYWITGTVVSAPSPFKFSEAPFILLPILILLYIYFLYVEHINTFLL